MRSSIVRMPASSGITAWSAFMANRAVGRFGSMFLGRLRLEVLPIVPLPARRNDSPRAPEFSPTSFARHRIFIGVNWHGSSARDGMTRDPDPEALVSRTFPR